MKLKITWSNGDTEKVERTEEQGQSLLNDIYKNVFQLSSAFCSEDPNDIRLLYNFNHVRKVEVIE